MKRNLNLVSKGLSESLDREQVSNSIKIIYTRPNCIWICTTGMDMTIKIYNTLGHIMKGLILTNKYVRLQII